MRPENQTRTDGGAIRKRNEGELDTWRALQAATKKKRADLLSDIVGHPKGAPSVEELDYMNPPLSEDAIRRHLQALEDVGVLRSRELEKGERVRNFPRKFYEVTDEARALFDRNDLFPEEPWQREYESVEKTPRIQEVEAMPRPGDVSAP